MPQRNDQKPNRRFPWKLSKEQRASGEKARFGLYSVSTSNAVKTRHDLARERGKKDAAEVCWHYDGRPWNRYQMMALLVARVSEGESLVDICANTELPTIKEIRGWYKNHPDFEAEMKEADACRGAIMGELALKAATTVKVQNPDTGAWEDQPLRDKDDVPAAKLKHDAYAKHAARLNTDYQDKQVIKQEGELDRLTEEQLNARAVAILEANPALRKLLGGSEGEVIDTDVVQGELACKETTIEENAKDGE